MTLPSQPEIQREIQERLKRRFLDRLAQRVKRMRKQLLERHWQDLVVECRQLRESGDTFGFERIKNLAQAAEATLPKGEVLRARPLPTARQAVEALITEIDDILTEHSISR